MELTQCWYVGKEGIEETKGRPAIMSNCLWVCEDEIGPFHVALGHNLFLTYEEARAELLQRLCRERDRIHSLIAEVDADPIYSG